MISTVATAASPSRVGAATATTTDTIAAARAPPYQQNYTPSSLLLYLTLTLLFICAFVPHIVRASSSSSSSSSSASMPSSSSHNDDFVPNMLFYTEKPTAPYVSPRAHLQPRTPLPVRTYAHVISEATARWKLGQQLQREAIKARLEKGGDFLSQGEKERLQAVMTQPELPLPPVPGWWDFRNDSYWNHTCPGVNRVRDQGDCAADWAATVASTFTDRLCIQTNGTIKQDISIQDILSCCGWKCGLGCNGGYSWKAWKYLSESGAVTGTGFNTSGVAAGCLPYEIPPCHLTDNNGTARACDSVMGVTQTPSCPRRCQDGHEWEYDKYYTYPPYQLENNITTIQAELFYNGPMSATIDLYQDFLDQLPNNIYRWNQQGVPIGALTIKIIGYGTDYGVEYWAAAPTWGENWGANGGFFKIHRGNNECNVEATVAAANIRIYNATAPNSQQPVITPLFAKHLGIRAIDVV